MKKYIWALFISVLLFQSPSFAEDEHKHDDHAKHDDHDGHVGHDDHDGHESSKAVGAGKAISENSKEEGVKLSPEAISKLKLELMSVSGSLVQIPKKALVKVKDETFVYRYRKGFFKMIAAKVMIDSGAGLKVKLSDITFGDQIVTSGVELLRVSDVYANDESHYGHAH